MNIDFHGRRIINAGRAKNNFDYVTKLDMDDALAGLTPEASSFSDDFTRSLIGSDYVYTTYRNTNGDSYFGGSIVANQFAPTHFGTSAANGQQAFLIPRSLIGSSKIYGLSQFAQITYISAAAYLGGGISCLVRWDDDIQRAYTLEFLTVPPIRLRLLKWNSSSTQTVISLNPTTFTANDVFKLNVTVTSSKNTLEIFKNGTSVYSVDDSDAVRPVAGVPALAMGPDFQSGGSIVFDTFSCGIL